MRLKNSWMQKLIHLILNSKLLLLFAILCTLFIGYLSLADISSLPKLEVENEDKLYHITAYFVLNTIWLMALMPCTSVRLKYNILISLGIIVFGIIIEVLQDQLTSYRAFDNYDILANSIGVILSLICFEFYKKIFFKNINVNWK